MRFAYADPPYFGLGAKLYGYPEWDNKERHFELVSALKEDYDGWALSCLPRDLVWLLPECPETIRVGAWVKSWHQWFDVSVQHAWEPVLFDGGREIKRRTPLVRDWVKAQNVPGSAKWRDAGIVGTKPEGFCSWVLDVLGFDAEQDEIVDLFPGSGVMSRVADQGKLYA